MPGGRPDPANAGNLVIAGASKLFSEEVAEVLLAAGESEAGLI